MSQGTVKIPEPKVNVEIDQLKIDLVSLDKVKLYAKEVENLPWFSAFLFLFLGILLNRILIQGFDSKDPVTGILILVILIMFFFVIKTYLAKRNTWQAVKTSKFNLKEN